MVLAACPVLSCKDSDPYRRKLQSLQARTIVLLYKDWKGFVLSLLIDTEGEEERRVRECLIVYQSRCVICVSGCFREYLFVQFVLI